MKTAAHCATPYLHGNGVWIHTQIAGLRRYRPIVLTQEAANLDQFPAPVLYTAEDYPRFRRLANRVVRRLTGEYPFYSDILRREGAVVLHAHFGHQGCRCLKAKCDTGLPMVTSFYGYDAARDPWDPRWRERYVRLFAAGECFLVEGSAMGRRLVEGGCPEDRIRVHHLGVDLERIPYRPRQPAHPVRFLVCAPFREKKGIPDAVTALGRALAERPFPCRLVLIGDGPERPRISAAIARAGLQDLVELLGVQPYARVIGELGRCHILLQTSVTAADGDTEGGAPVILLDAQAAGVPVVATRHADIGEYVREGESGLLAPEGDVDAIAAHIRTLVDRPECWEGMGRAGRSHVAAEYNAQVQAARLELLYDELTN